MKGDRRKLTGGVRQCHLAAAALQLRPAQYQGLGPQCCWACETLEERPLGRTPACLCRLQGHVSSVDLRCLEKAELNTALPEQFAGKASKT